MVCIPQHLLRPITNYMHVWVHLLPYWIQHTPFLHHVKTSLVSSRRRCWNLCHSTRGLLVPPLCSFNFHFCPQNYPKEYSHHQRKIHISTIMKRDQSNSHLQTAVVSPCYYKELWITLKSLSLNLKMATNRERSFNVFSQSEMLPMTLLLLNCTRVIKSLTAPWRAVSQFGLSWSPLKEYWLNLQ